MAPPSFSNLALFLMVYYTDKVAKSYSMTLNRSLSLKVLPRFEPQSRLYLVLRHKADLNKQKISSAQSDSWTQS